MHQVREVRIVAGVAAIPRLKLDRLLQSLRRAREIAAEAAGQRHRVVNMICVRRQAESCFQARLCLYKLSLVQESDSEIVVVLGSRGRRTGSAGAKAACARSQIAGWKRVSV